MLLILAGLWYTNHLVAERLLYFWHWRLFLPLTVCVSIWSSALLAIFYLAFTPAGKTRFAWITLVALSTFIGDLFYRIMGSRLSLHALEAMGIGYFEVGELANIINSYQSYIWRPLIGTAMLCIGLLIRVPPSMSLAARPLSLLPFVPYLPLTGLVLYMAGDYSLSSMALPQQFHPASVLTVHLLSSYDEPSKAPAEIPLTEPAQAQHIVLIVDESVRGDYIELDRAMGTTPYLALKAAEIADFGLAIAGNNCSNGSNAVLRLGANPDRIGRKDYRLLRNPSVWKYARAAGFETSFLDGQEIAQHNYDYFNAEERGLVDNLVELPENINVNEADLFLADALAELLNRNTPQFAFVNKRGAHFPYDSSYPLREAVFVPTMSAGGSTGDKTRRENSYKNSIRWNVDGFFNALLTQVELDNVVIIYTSDHGQNLLDDGTPVTHCRRLFPVIQEAVVPLLVFTQIDELSQRFQEAAERNRDRASGFQIFPTLLTLMGYPEAEVRETYYDDLFVYQKKRLGFTSGPIAGAHVRRPLWNTVEGLSGLRQGDSPQETQP